ncbi:MAG: hypothetical protein DMG21_07305 [Acidobacteria bacterium]|nr:MAG: hypothetical protein DMG21_07305 [Acidobacteriota bacterium]
MVSISTQQRTRISVAAVFLGGAIVVSGLVLTPKAGLLVLGGGALLGLLAVIIHVCQGRIDGVMLMWAAFFPLGSLVMFPRERSIVTLERVVVLLACVGLSWVKPSRLVSIPVSLRRAGLACLAFIAVAGATLVKSPDRLSAGRLLSDSFLIPLLFGWCVIAWFEVRRCLRAIHTAVCVSSIICAAVAAAEIATGKDLLPIEGSKLYFSAGIARPNGPFASNDQLALVGGLSLFFLLFLHAALGPNLSAGRRVLHVLGTAAAIGNALTPMFRSVALALMLALVIDTVWEKKTSRRAWRGALILAFAGLIFSVSAFAPAVFEDRSSAANVYGRLAEGEQSLRVFRDHPLVGVGFSNFNRFVSDDPRYEASYDGVSSVDWPHNNIATALTETGTLGFIPYMLTHVFLLVAFWRLGSRSSAGSLVWKYSVYMFLTYWLTGMTESTGFELLNAWYAFVLAVCYKFALTEPDPSLPTKAQVPVDGLSASARIFSPGFLR